MDLKFIKRNSFIVKLFSGEEIIFNTLLSLSFQSIYSSVIHIFVETLTVKF